MPTYPQNRTYRSGFYNTKIINGVKDRTYNSNDMTKFYTGLFTDGVKPDENGTIGSGLRVDFVSGLTIRVLAGDGLFGSRFFTNISAYNIILDPITSITRYDCVIVKADESDNVRDTTIYIKSLDHVPTIADLIRSATTKEYCLGYVHIPANASGIDQQNISETRPDENLCGLITGAFNQFSSGELYNQFTAAFNQWFNEIKNQFVSGATLIHNYFNEVVSTTANQRVINIGIPQYVKSTDVLMVMVEGRTFTEGVNYVVNSNTQITLTIGLPVVGTKIEFQVLKSVDGSDAQTVVSQVNTLINQMNVVNRKLEYDYYCNGTNDNILIGNLVRNFLTGGTDRGSCKINVIGTIGMTVPAGGTGTVADPYYWFNFNAGSNRKVIVDFSRAGQIAPTITNGTSNLMFHSNNDIDVIGANIVATNKTANSVIRVMNTAYGVVYFEKCRFYIEGYKDSCIALRGTFTNCRGTVSNEINNSYCFLNNAANTIKIVGGEYYAYCKASNIQSSVVAHSGSTAITIMYGVNCPTVAKTGYYQTNAIMQWAGSGLLNCTDLISTLTLGVISGISNIRGTIAMNKPNAM